MDNKIVYSVGLTVGESKELFEFIRTNLDVVNDWGVVEAVMCGLENAIDQYEADSVENRNKTVGERITELEEEWDALDTLDPEQFEDWMPERMTAIEEALVVFMGLDK